MPFLKTETDINWHYELEGTGPPLLFIHGWGMNRRIWVQQFKYFSKFYKVLIVDLPGHGKSSWQKVSLAEIAKDIQALFTHLDFQEISIISSSFGGLVALKLYDICPEKIKSLVFVGSPPRFAQAEDYPFGLQHEHIRKLAGQIATDYPAIINIFFRSLFTKHERASRRFKWIQIFRRTDDHPDRTALLYLLEILTKSDLRETLYKISLPIQFINGMEDYICPWDVFRDIQKAIPHARFDWFHQCGHFPFLIKPREFNRVLADFLNHKSGK